MSKKTDNIYKSIETISQLSQKLDEYNKGLAAQGEPNRELENLCFGLNHEVKNLTFWFSSLYSYNGKSTSYAKKSASRENGKKGGRPPKEVTLRKRRIAELIPDLQHRIKFTNDAEEEAKLKKELRRAKAELKKVKEELETNIKKTRLG